MNFYNSHEVRFDPRTGKRLALGEVPSSEVPYRPVTEHRGVAYFLRTREIIDGLLTEAEGLVLAGNYTAARERCQIVQRQPEGFRLPMDGLRLGAILNRMSL